MERGILVGVALFSSAAIVFAVSFLVGGLASTVLLAVAAGDAILALVFLMRGLRTGSESSVQMPADPPHVVMDKVRAAQPELLNSLGPCAEEVLALVQQRRKIDAIKRVREATSLDLKDAKGLVDRLEAAIRRQD
jgi:ribosomal protein L7/L12